MSTLGSDPLADRRREVSFDPDYFAHRAEAGRAMAPLDAFRHVLEINLWGDRESISGSGSSLDQTRRLRQDLPELCRQLGIRSILDLPCGDGHWMAKVDLAGIAYTGADFLPELVAANAARAATDRRFVVLDLTASPLPPADLLLCRDCLVHFSFADVARALANIRRAPITYLLTTTFPAETANLDITTGDWRPVNLERAPFNFPPPAARLTEGCTEAGGRFLDKSLGLWAIQDLPTPMVRAL
jgi:SAM-dependent methyltransferase